MAKILGLEWNGDFSSNVWTAASPSVPTGQEVSRTGTGVGIVADGGLGGMRVLERPSSAYAMADATLDASARLDYLGGALLILIDPRASSGDAPFVGLRNLANVSNGRLNINRQTAGNLHFDLYWDTWNSYNQITITLPSNPFWLWMRIEPANATVAQRIQYRVWEYGASVPGSFTTSSGAGSAATSGNFAELDYLEFFQRDASETPMAVGLMVIDDDPDADMSSYLPAAGGATLTTPTATSITQTAATIGCTSDTAEGLVHAGVTTTATPPSDAQLIAGSGGGIVAAGSVSAVAGANTVGLTGLTANTGYFRHFIQSDGAGTATSTMLSPDETAGFTTLATNVGFRITGIQAPDGSGVGNVDPVSVAIWNNSAAAHGAAADTVVSDAAIASGTLEVAHAGTLTEDVLVDVQYSTGSPAVLRSVRGTATLIDLDE